MLPPKSPRRPLASSLGRCATKAAVLAALSMASAHAGTVKWDPKGPAGAPGGVLGGDGNWDTAGLFWFSPLDTQDHVWSNAAFDIAEFTNAPAGANYTVTITEPISAGGLLFSSGGYTIAATAGNALTLGGTAPTITVTNATDTAVISAPIAGATAWSKEGAGALTLSGANTFSGGLTLNAGTLNLNSATALGAATSAFTISSGTLDNTSGGALTLANNNAMVWAGDFAFTGSNALNLGTGAVTLAATRNVAVNANTLTVGGVISGAGGITKTGNGTLALGGVNTYNGRLTVSGGAVSVTAVNNLGTGPITLDGGKLVTNQTATQTFAAAQIITIGAGGGTIDNPVAQKLQIGVTGSTNLLIGSGTLTRNGSANGSSLSNIFAITVANTNFTGAVILNGGVTETVANGLGSGGAGNSITVNNGAEFAANNATIANPLIINGGIFGGDNGTSTFSGPITVNGSASIRLGDFWQAANRNLNITGALSGAAGSTLSTIGYGSSPTTASGQILTLNPSSGNNAGYLGGLSLYAGSNVFFSTANALIGGTTTINSNATGMGGVGYGYDFGATIPAFTNSRAGTTTGGVFGLGAAVGTSAALDMSAVGGGGMWLGSQTTGSYIAATLGADGGVYRLGGGTGTLFVPAAVLSGANNLMIGDVRANGNGTVVLGGQSTFTGGVTVANGTISADTLNSVNGGAPLLAASNLGAPVTIANGTIHLGASTSTGGLRYTGPGETTDRVIDLAGTTGGATLDQSGAGTLKFTSSPTFSGAGAKTLTLQGSGVGTGEISAKIAGGVTGSASPLTINKAGSGTWLLSGTGNTAQNITISGGVLDTGAAGLTLNDGTASTVAATGNATINGKLIIGSAGSSGNWGDWGAPAGVTLTLNAVIADGAGTSLDFYSSTALGTTVVNGANTYSGVTNIVQQQVVVNSINSVTTNAALGTVHSASSNLGAPTTVSNGTILLGSNGSGVLKYVGSGEVTDRVIDLKGSSGTPTLDASGTGLLKFVSNFTSSGAGAKTLVLQGTGAGEIAANIVDNNTTNKTSLAKSGSGTWTLSGANSYTGGTTVNSGVLLLDFAKASGASNIVSTSSALTLNGGVLQLNGKAGATNGQAFASTAIAAGSSAVMLTNDPSSNTVALNLGGITRSAGGVVNFTNPVNGTLSATNGIVTSTNNGAGGILGGYATVGGVDWATKDAGGFITALPSGSYVAAPTTGGSTTTNYSLPGAATMTGSATFNSLKITDTAASQVLALGTNPLTFSGAAGGLLYAGGTSNAYQITGSGAGIIGAGAANEFIVNTATGTTLTIAAPIIGSGAGSLTKAGAGKLTLSTSSSFTGDVNLTNGVLEAVLTKATTTPLGGQNGTTYRKLNFFNGATFRTTASFNDDVPSTANAAFVFNFGNGGGTLDVGSGATLTLDDGSGTGTASTNAQLQGSGDLVKIGAGTLSLGNGSSNFSNFTGQIIINAGTLTVGNTSGGVSPLGSTAAGTVIAAGAAFNLNGSTNSAAEPLTLNGSGVSNGGALTNGSATAASFAGPVTLATDTSIGAANNITLSNSIYGPGMLTKIGTGTLVLSGTPAYTGGTTITAGTLQIGSKGTTGVPAPGPIVNNATLAFDRTDALRVDNVISGTGGLTVGSSSIANNLAMLTLGGANSFTGNVNINSGGLTITNSSALGTGTKTVAMTNGTAGNPNLHLNSMGGADIALPSSISFNTSNTSGGTAALPGTGTIVNDGGNNTIAGAVTMTSGGGGTVLVSNAGSLTLSGAVTANTSGRALYMRGAAPGLISGNIGTGATNPFTVFKDAGAGTWTLSGTNSYNGATSVSAGTLQFAKRASLYNSTTANWTAANITVGNGATLALNVGGTNEFTPSDVDLLRVLGTGTTGFTSGSSLGLDTSNASGGNFTYDQAISNTNGGANALGITKLGVNTLTLAGANTYTGPTKVNGGALFVAASGSISGSTAVTVAATLDGAGTINSPVTVLSGGVITGGGSNAAGALTLGNAFSLNSGAHLALELGATGAGNSDSLNVAGNVTLGGSLDLTLLPTFANNVGDVFTAILNSGSGAASGVFSNVTPINATTGTLVLADGHQFLVNYAFNADSGAVANDVSLTLVAVPEPSTGMALLGGLGMLAGAQRFRRRKA